jgi:UPF0716 protein FxsA
MRLFILLVLLSFPIAEIYLLLQLADEYGWWLLLYLVVITYLGLQLIKGERQMMTAKMMQSIQTGGNPFKTMMGSARNLVAGILLVIPGVITDIIAVILLLIPIQQSRIDTSASSYQSGDSGTDNHGFEGHYRATNTRSANDDVIEGEYEEIKEAAPDATIISIDKETDK